MKCCKILFLINHELTFFNSKLFSNFTYFYTVVNTFSQFNHSKKSSFVNIFQNSLESAKCASIKNFPPFSKKKFLKAELCLVSMQIFSIIEKRYFAKIILWKSITFRWEILGLVVPNSVLFFRFRDTQKVQRINMRSDVANWQFPSNLEKLGFACLND